MDFVKIEAENFEKLMNLQKAYRVEIGECMPINEELESLKNAIPIEQISISIQALVTMKISLLKEES